MNIVYSVRNMISTRPFAILLIALSCYVFCGYTKTVRDEIDHTQTLASTKLNEPAANQLNMNSDNFLHMKVSPLHSEGRQKRSQFDFISDYNTNNNNNNNNNRNFNEMTDEEEEDSQSLVPTEATLQRTNDDYDLESLTPFTYFLLLQKLRQLQTHEPTYRVRTPRLGRSIDLQMLDDIGTGSGLLGRGFDIGGTMTRLSKKSVPFKPRLGKRTKYCD